MKKFNVLTLALLTGISAIAADTNAPAKAEARTTNEVTAAIAKLNAAANYSWTVKTDIPNMPFEMSPTQGKAEKDGLAIVTQQMMDNTMQAVFKGDKVAVNAQDGWQLAGTGEGDMGAMMAGMIVGGGTAAKQAETLCPKVKELKAGEAGLYSGDLSPAGAGELLSFGPRRGGGSGAAPANAKGTAKFWLKDGALVKFESKVQGKAPSGPGTGMSKTWKSPAPSRSRMWGPPSSTSPPMPGSSWKPSSAFPPPVMPTPASPLGFQRSVNVSERFRNRIGNHSHIHADHSSLFVKGHRGRHGMSARRSQPFPNRTACH